MGWVKVGRRAVRIRASEIERLLDDGLVLPLVKG